jgi:hypothetical protein
MLQHRTRRYDIAVNWRGFSSRDCHGGIAWSLPSLARSGHVADDGGYGAGPLVPFAS